MRQCINFNVIATKTIIELSHKMVNLDCFIHVSSAYAHCQLKTVDENLYPIKATASQIIEALNWMDESTLNKCSEFLMDGRPNTYTFTKAVAEHCVNEFRGQLPVAIARPSIVTASLKEPFPGWLDSYNGKFFFNYFEFF
jgi:fatty acyl-CoA reductase